MASGDGEPFENMKAFIFRDSKLIPPCIFSQERLLWVWLVVICSRACAYIAMKASLAYLSAFASCANSFVVQAPPTSSFFIVSSTTATRGPQVSPVASRGYDRRWESVGQATSVMIRTQISNVPAYPAYYLRDETRWWLHFSLKVDVVVMRAALYIWSWVWLYVFPVSELVGIHSLSKKDLFWWHRRTYL